MDAIQKARTIFDGLDQEGRAIIRKFDAHQDEARLIMVERQHKYGPHNISAMGFDGVIVRMNDKFARLRNGLAAHGDESVADTLYDLANYALIGLMVYEGSWPKPPELTTAERLMQLANKIHDLQKEHEALYCKFIEEGAKQ